MPGKAVIQADFGRRRVWARKGPFSCPSVAMSVRTRPMFAIPFAVNLGSVAVISRRCGILGCNERAHGPPMFAIPTPDVCRSLHVFAARPGDRAPQPSLGDGYHLHPDGA